MGVQLPSPTHMEIIKLSPESNLVPIARLYAQAFAGWPWFEVGLGPGCGEFRSEQPGQPCPCGCGTLSPAYPETETADYIIKEITKPLAVALLAVSNSQLAGFAWGFQMTGSQFAQEKYKNSSSRPQIIQTVGTQTYFYISEVGVDPLYQSNGAGTQLSISLAQGNLGLPLLMRTNQASPMLKIAQNQLQMQPAIASWLDIVDPENPARVILTKPKS
ncbi:MAG: hypothetical protein UY06_C0004G0031 [Candidatus Amesbacteria bacterium GW2011_GWA2_47_70]|nr:MAG: hypothetical protein UX52_C0011G0050 [Candidatus Amesbacteria bacterium GW2011_GWA1_46_35]KKU69093.1 MAG: hypothetical protein UX93_C0003G0085 [Microgenomates group bacterium GW2011_GWC1_47_20]KKU80210.1 MAG: hypothetical protein UY06_C0004G0031 [Candidatus Amesbacteria bacterium GW2011_GWA2_47_70]